MDSQSYKTRQKLLIDECVKKTGGRHFNVEDIADMLDASGSHVGKTTVYRRLDKMVSDGIIRKYMLDGKSGACYQYNTVNSCEHFHLKCISCGRLIHADCSFLERLSQHVLSEHGFEIDGSRTVFYGKCSECGCGQNYAEKSCCCEEKEEE